MSDRQASTNAQGDPELSNVPEETKELDTNSGKPSSISNLDNKKEPKSPEFNSLKDIDGNVIKHDEAEENVPEDPNQKVHFNLEATEEIQEVEIHPPQHPAKNPRKSILKRSDSIQKTLVNHDKKDNNGEDGNKSGDESDSDQDDEYIQDSVEFLSSWKMIKRDPKAVEDFLSDQANPDNFHTIFAHGIEPELLSELITTSNNLSDSLNSNPALALKVLENLTKIHDFEKSSKSLSDQQNSDVHTIFVKLRASLKLEDASLTALQNKYTS